jgi:hypothetical protein
MEDMFAIAVFGGILVLVVVLIAILACVIIRHRRRKYSVFSAEDEVGSESASTPKI